MVGCKGAAEAQLLQDWMTAAGWTDYTRSCKARILIHWWAHGDLNPGSSPCKGDVITELDYGPKHRYCEKPFKS